MSTLYSVEPRQFDSARKWRNKIGKSLPKHCVREKRERSNKDKTKIFRFVITFELRVSKLFWCYAKFHF